MIKFFVITNRAEHSGWVQEVDMSDVRTRDNEYGWTNQSLCGSHANIAGEYENKEDADEHLRNFLKCDSVEKGTYCYNHNNF